MQKESMPACGVPCQSHNSGAGSKPLEAKVIVVDANEWRGSNWYIFRIY